MANTKSYSQNNEQEIILNALSGITGKLLDIGAYAPEAFSNSRALIQMGWEAVLVEPSPEPFSSLKKEYSSSPLITLVNAAVTAGPAKLTEWYDSGGDAISTTNLAHKTKWETGWKCKFTAFWIYTLPMPDLFDKFGFNYDFINIDVEGTNIELFRALPWTLLKQLKVICVEHDLHQLEMSQLAREHGFSPLAMNGENLILTKKL